MQHRSSKGISEPCHFLSIAHTRIERGQLENRQILGVFEQI